MAGARLVRHRQATPSGARTDASFRRVNKAIHAKTKTRHASRRQTAITIEKVQIHEGPATDPPTRGARRADPPRPRERDVSLLLEVIARHLRDLIRAREVLISLPASSGGLRVVVAEGEGVAGLVGYDIPPTPSMAGSSRAAQRARRLDPAGSRIQPSLRPIWIGSDPRPTHVSDASFVLPARSSSMPRRRPHASSSPATSKLCYPPLKMTDAVSPQHTRTRAGSDWSVSANESLPSTGRSTSNRGAAPERGSRSRFRSPDRPNPRSPGHAPFIESCPDDAVSDRAAYSVPTRPHGLGVAPPRAQRDRPLERIHLRTRAVDRR